jgi:hypothetical protein
MASDTSIVGSQVFFTAQAARYGVARSPRLIEKSHFGERRATSLVLRHNLPVPHSVFLSYSHADKPLARALARGLQDEGIHVWIDEGELRAGDSIVKRVATAVDSTDFVVALVSVHSVESRWCQRELSLAITDELDGQRVRVLPVRVGDIRMPATLRDKLYLTLDEANLYAATKRLVLDIRRHMETTAGDVVTDPMGAIRQRIAAVGSGTLPGAALLRQYLAYVDADNYKACFMDWLSRYHERPEGATDETLFWLHSLAAVSGARLGDADPAYIARFGGYADTFRDYGSTVQSEMAQIVWRLYSGESLA